MKEPTSLQLQRQKKLNECVHSEAFNKLKRTERLAYMYMILFADENEKFHFSDEFETCLGYSRPLLLRTFIALEKVGFIARVSRTYNPVRLLDAWKEETP